MNAQTGLLISASVLIIGIILTAMSHRRITATGYSRSGTRIMAVGMIFICIGIIAPLTYLISGAVSTAKSADAKKLTELEPSIEAVYPRETLSDNAISVYYRDKKTGETMRKDMYFDGVTYSDKVEKISYKNDCLDTMVTIPQSYVKQDIRSELQAEAVMSE